MMRHVFSVLCALGILAAAVACAPTQTAVLSSSTQHTEQVALAHAPVVLAQATAAPSATATRAATQAAATQVATTPDSAADLTPYITLDLQAGFPLDPFLVSVNGGGDMQASALSPDCVGYVHENPTVTVNYSGQAELVRAFYYTSHDATLVIKAPDGKFTCSDDFTELEHNPSIKLTAPAAGKYELWVGSYDEGELIPGLLVLTAQDDLTPATFDLANLIDRPEPNEQHLLLPLIRKALTAAGARATAVSNGEPFVVDTVTADGDVPAFDLPTRDVICNGFVSLKPSALINVPADAEHLIVYFEGDADSTLVVLGPNNQVWCNDDFAAGENTHPLVDVDTPAEGVYGIFVGRVNPATAVTGKLTVTTAPGAQPGPSSK